MWGLGLRFNLFPMRSAIGFKISVNGLNKVSRIDLMVAGSVGGIGWDSCLDSQSHTARQLLRTPAGLCGGGDGRSARISSIVRAVDAGGSSQRCRSSSHVPLPLG
jgi:hypothetical protein